MSYATTGAEAVMWKAEPIAVPCAAASVLVMAGVTLEGQVIFSPGPALAPGRSASTAIATSPAGIVALAIGVNCTFCPDPVGMYVNFDGSSVIPPYETVIVTG